MKLQMQYTITTEQLNALTAQILDLSLQAERTARSKRRKAKVTAAEQAAMDLLSKVIDTGTSVLVEQ